jgi:alpha-glucosidase
MKTSSKRLLFLALAAAVFTVAQAISAEQRLTSPDSKLAIIVSDTDGLHYRVEVDGKPVVADSQLGLEFQDGTKLGTAAVIIQTETASHDGVWENRFGQRGIVPDRWKERRLTLTEKAAKPRIFGLIVRAYDNGVAFRYDLPQVSGLGNFVLTRELTEFRFAGDYRCWFGEESPCAENQYPEGKLSKIPAVTSSKKRAGQPFLSVLPLLVEAPGCYVAVAESDLLDWAGLFLTGTGTPSMSASLATREDRNGLVASSVPRVSPWRVLMIGRQAGDLVNSDLIATLATPNKLGDVSWVKPGICAWDSWWTGVNPGLPQFTGIDARGDTASHKDYIDLAAEMGWPYQLVDWFWYRDDPTKPLPHVDLPEVFAHAKKRGVRLFVWMDSKDLRKVGLEKTFSAISAWRAAGVKVDFMDSDSQETVRWYADALEVAAKHKLMVDFHGAYKPTGLARTYPNFITQEGVLGNEYNKLNGNKCNPLHTVTLPFTRGLLGPMDFTPGGFLNRAPQDFRVTSPTQVMGTRSRQLSMTVVYLSPLLVLCDSPANYHNQPAVEFFRGLPTVWDETTVLDAEPGKTIAVARRSGDRWYLAAMNGDAAATLSVSLKFLGQGKWTLRSFADKPGGAATDVVETTTLVDSTQTQTLTLSPAGGFVAVLTPNENFHHHDNTRSSSPPFSPRTPSTHRG